MRKLPYFRFFVQDFWSDKNVEAMSWEEIGFYNFLLGRAWIDGEIPRCVDDLMKYARCRGTRRAKLEKMWSKVECCFEIIDQRFTNKRIELERGLATNLSQQQSQRGKSSASKRKKQKETTSTAVEPHTVEPERNHSRRNPSDSDSYTDTKRERVTTVEHSGSLSRTPTGYDPAPGWERFASEYPAHRLNRQPNMDPQLWVSLIESAEQEAAVLSGLGKWKQSEEWQLGMIPWAARFLSEGLYRVAPAPAKKKGESFEEKMQRIDAKREAIFNEEELPE